MLGVNSPARVAMPDLPIVTVDADEFSVMTTDGVLMANLQASLAVCLYDAVFEPGALLHLRAVPDKDRDIELTDVVLAADLLLLEQTMAALKETAPRAQYWQAKVIVHCPPDAAALGAVAYSVATFARDWLTEAGVTVIDRQALGGERARVQFRPQMGQLRCSAVPA
jgi:chemotaxis receptor (MCP) glutamine deamidase CheD